MKSYIDENIMKFDYNLYMVYYHILKALKMRLMKMTLQFDDELHKNNSSLDLNDKKFLMVTEK